MQAKDIGAHLLAAAAGAVYATAGGAGDATELDGPWIDRQGYLSCKLVIHYKATLAEDKVLNLAANLQDATASDGTGAADFGTAVAAADVATGGSGGSTEEGVIVADFNLDPANQYIRAQFTPNMDAADTDVAIVAAAIILGGARQLPAS
jgi:hypothetical protein